MITEYVFALPSVPRDVFQPPVDNLLPAVSGQLGKRSMADKLRAQVLLHLLPHPLRPILLRSDARQDPSQGTIVVQS